MAAHQPNKKEQLMKKFETTKIAVMTFLEKLQKNNDVIEKKIAELTKQKDSIAGQIESLADEFVQAEIDNETKSKNQIDTQITELLNKEKNIDAKIGAFKKVLNDTTRDKKKALKIKTISKTELNNINQQKTENTRQQKLLEKKIKEHKETIKELKSKSYHLDNSKQQAIRQFWSISKYMYTFKSIETTGKVKARLESYEELYVEIILAHIDGHPPTEQMQGAFDNLGIICK